MSNSSLNRILHIAPTPFFSDRGCHIRIRGLVDALNAMGIKNRVCTYGLGRDVHDVDTVRSPAIPGYTKTAAGPTFFKFIADPLLVFTTVRQIWKYDPDVLHCHLHEGVLIGWLAKYLAIRPRLRIGFDMQGGLEQELLSHGHLKNRVVRSLVQATERFIVERADIYCCSSQSSVDLLINEFHIDRSRVALVSDGVDQSWAGSEGAHRLSRERKIALYTGGLTESKGISSLKEIILEARTRNLPIDFLIVGYPTDDLQVFIDTNNIKDCTLTGKVRFDELPSYLRNADLCLEPKSGSTTEASGKLLNYMAFSKPIVCFDTKNNRSILNDSGFFAENPTAAAFVDQMQIVIENKTLATERGRSAQQIVAREFSWQASAARILKQYAELR